MRIYFKILILLLINLALAQEDVEMADAEEDNLLIAPNPVAGNENLEVASTDSNLSAENSETLASEPDSEPEAEPEPESEPEMPIIYCKICQGSDCMTDTASTECSLGESCGQIINIDSSTSPQSITYQRSCMTHCYDNQYSKCHMMGNYTTCVQCCHENDCNGVDYMALSGTGGREIEKFGLVLALIGFYLIF